jgi:hypothetical protein
MTTKQSAAPWVFVAGLVAGVAGDRMPLRPPASQARPLGALSTPSSGSAYYANCSEARAAGAAPIRAGEPGYASHLDRDGDGVACE